MSWPLLPRPFTFDAEAIYIVAASSGAPGAAPRIFKSTDGGSWVPISADGPESSVLDSDSPIIVEGAENDDIARKTRED